MMGNRKEENMDIKSALEEAYRYGRGYTDQGKVADYIPELAKQHRDTVGATLIDPDFETVSVGEDPLYSILFVRVKYLLGGRYESL